MPCILGMCTSETTAYNLSSIFNSMDDECNVFNIVWVMNVIFAHIVWMMNVIFLTVCYATTVLGSHAPSSHLFI